MNQINLANQNSYTRNLLNADRELRDRKKDKNKVLKLGRYITTENGTEMWVAFPKEECACCRGRYNKPLYGRVLQRHLCSTTHVANLYNVDRFDLVKLDFMLEHMLVNDKNQMNKVVNNINHIFG